MFENIEEKSEYTAFFLKKVIDAIIEHYYFNITYEELYHAAIRGMTECLDEYSLYIKKNEFQNNYNNIKPNNKVVEDYFFNEISDYKEISVNKNIKIIKITKINKQAVQLLKETIERLKKDGINKVIIDLRDNMGGFIDCTVEICNLIVSKKTLFKSYDKKKNLQTYESNLDHRPFNEIIVLTNKKTMSAAEIIALSLQEDGNIVIGQPTFGKGVSQKDFTIYGNGILKITTKEYFKNTGEKINKIGVIPNIIVECSNSELEDKILNTAYSYITKNLNLK